MTLYVQAIVNGLLVGGVYSLMAVGLSLIFGVMRVINIAHGTLLMLALAAPVALLAQSVSAAEAKQESAGRLADGTEAFAITLKAANGVSARVLTYGATLQSLMAPVMTSR